MGPCSRGRGERAAATLPGKLSLADLAGCPGWPHPRIYFGSGGWVTDVVVKLNLKLPALQWQELIQGIRFSVHFKGSCIGRVMGPRCAGHVAQPWQLRSRTLTELLSLPIVSCVQSQSWRARWLCPIRPSEVGLSESLP